MLFFFSGLQDIIFDINKAIKGSISLGSEKTVDDLLDTLSALLNRLVNKSHQENFLGLKDISSGCLRLFDLLKEVVHYHLDTTKDLKNRLKESLLVNDSLKQRCNRVENLNQKLIKQLDQLEYETKETRMAHSEALAQQQILQQQLKKAETSQHDALSHVNLIQQTITQKENAIAQLDKEVRRLNSFKKIQEMRGALGRTPQDMKKIQVQKQEYRQSMPSSQYNSPLTSPANEFYFDDSIQNSDLTFKSKLEQLKLKEELFKKFDLEIKKAKLIEAKLMQELKEAKDEGSFLVLKLREEQLKNSLDINTEENEMIMSHNSLFEELNMLDIDKDSVKDRSQEKYDKNSTEKSTQTSIMDEEEIINRVKAKGPDKRSGCWICF